MLFRIKESVLIGLIIDIYIKIGWVASFDHFGVEIFWKK